MDGIRDGLPAEQKQVVTKFKRPTANQKVGTGAMTGTYLIGSAHVRFVRRLRRWFRTNRRNYPWRRARDPYHVFIAEFMLQRTGGQQVVPVYKRFITRFHSLRSATDASGQELANILRPLGRTKRFRVLMKALRFIASELRGRFPRNPDRLQAIPGVGPYTARAIACFGFGRRVGLFDPTIARILTRIFGIRSDRSRPHADRAMWSAVDELIPRRRVREFNLAMLDFGALVCRRQNPSCPMCPMNDFCLYWREHRNLREPGAA